MEQYRIRSGRCIFSNENHSLSLSIFFRQSVAPNASQKIQNPYYANPFFRPKIVTNQQSINATTIAGNTVSLPPSRDSSTANTNHTNQTLTSASTTVVNRGRQPLSLLKTQNPIISTNGRTQEPETTVNTSGAQDDARRWAHSVASAPIARRTISDERSIGTFKTSETNVNYFNS